MVREVAAASEAQSVVAGVAQLATVDPFAVGDEERASFIEYPVVGMRAFACVRARAEAFEDSQLVEALKAYLGYAEIREVQPGDLIGCEDGVLVAVERYPSVAFGDVRRQFDNLALGETARSSPFSVVFTCVC